MCSYMVSHWLYTLGLCIQSQYIAHMSLTLESIRLLQLVAIDHTGIPTVFLPVKVFLAFLSCQKHLLCEAPKIASIGT